MKRIFFEKWISDLKLTSKIYSKICSFLYYRTARINFQKYFGRLNWIFIEISSNNTYWQELTTRLAFTIESTFKNWGHLDQASVGMQKCLGAAGHFEIFYIIELTMVQKIWATLPFFENSLLFSNIFCTDGLRNCAKIMSKTSRENYAYFLFKSICLSI